MSGDAHMHENTPYQDDLAMKTETVLTEDSQQQKQEPCADLELCRSQLKEWQNRFFYLSADFENYKKRVYTDRIAQTQATQAELLRKLLPVIDGIERAMAMESDTAAAPHGERAVMTASNNNAVMEGVRMVYQTFQTFLRENGVEEIPTTGQFNPELHEALSNVADQDYASGAIVQVLQKGYTLKGILLRPALVNVAQ